MAMCCESRDASKNISNHTTQNQMAAFTYGGHFLCPTNVRSHGHSKLIPLAPSSNPPSSSESMIHKSPTAPLPTHAASDANSKAALRQNCSFFRICWTLPSCLVLAAKNFFRAGRFRKTQTGHLVPAGVTSSLFPPRNAAHSKRTTQTWFGSEVL